MFFEGCLHPEQIKALRNMPLERRAELALGFIRSIRRIKAAALHAQHPEWSRQRVAAELRRLTLHARS
jgi:hypothetical protein